VPVLSENDRTYYAEVGPKMAEIQSRLFENTTLAENVARYRDMIDRLDVFKASPDAPNVCALHCGVELASRLKADIAVPHGQGPFPVVLHVHGNAVIWGSAESFRRTTLDFARGGVLAVMLDYRLAPEHRFPAAFEDVTFAARWLHENAARYGGDPSRMIMSGNSSGAGLAFAAARALAEAGEGGLLRGIAGFDGHYDRAAEPRSWLQDAYLGDDTEALLRDPRVSPNVGLKAGMLPRCLLTTGSSDFACANTLQFAQTLASAGIPFELRVFEGARHDAMRYPMLDVSREILGAFFGFVRAALA
jgi:acetyl esterase